MQKLLTKRLFFKKYPYKIQLRCEGSSLIKAFGFDYVYAQCKSDVELSTRRSKWQATIRFTIDKIALYQFATAIQPFCDDKVKCRVEGSHFSFFVEDEATFDNIIDSCKKWIVAVWAPLNKDELTFLTGNNRKIIVDELPYNKFTHKITFKTNWTKEAGGKFVEWLAKYPEDSYKISPTTLRYLAGTLNYCQDPFMYIAEAKMLTMLQLFAGDRIKYAEEFVPRATLLL